MKHDDDCYGCGTQILFQEAKGRPIPVTLALGYCEHCGYSTRSAYIHTVGGKRLCSTCADAEALATTKAGALEAFREASAG